MIPAGQSGQLKAKVKTNSGQTGRLTKTISVQTDAAGAESLRLTVSFNAVTPIVAAPAHRVYLNTVEGTSVEQRVLLHRADDLPLEARLVKTSLEQGLQVTLSPADGTEEPVGRQAPKPGDQWLVVTMDAPAASSHDGLISLATNDPRSPALELPLIVRVRPIIELRPLPVRMWPADRGPGGSSVLVRLSHSGRRSFEVTAVEVADPKLVTAKLESTGSQQIHSLRVTLAEGITIEGEELRTSVRIATTDPAKPVIELPVEVLPWHQSARRPVQPPPPAQPVEPGSAATAPPAEGG
ncbi:MAG TPA: hypothetical protein PLV66_11745 [Thermoanaerobaculales bacterium]|nr:hypothetical protein [Thermoanaerobaculales bacterium]